MADIDEGALRITIGNVQMVEFQAQPVGIEADLADGDRAMNRARDRPGQDAPQGVRRPKKTGYSIKYEDRRDRDRGATRPTPLACSRKKPFAAVDRGLQQAHRWLPGLLNLQRQATGVKSGVQFAPIAGASFLTGRLPNRPARYFTATGSNAVKGRRT